MTTSFCTSIKITLEFVNREELADIYCVLNSACLALSQKAADLNDDYLYKRSNEFDKFIEMFNPVAVLGKC